MRQEVKLSYLPKQQEMETMTLEEGPPTIVWQNPVGNVYQSAEQYGRWKPWSNSETV